MDTAQLGIIILVVIQIITFAVSYARLTQKVIDACKVYDKSIDKQDLRLDKLEINASRLEVSIAKIDVATARLEFEINRLQGK